MRTHLGTTCRSDIEGDPAHRKTIRAIGREFDFDRRVGKAQICSQRGADRRICRELQQARCIRINTQLLRRAQHAAGFDATQGRGLDCKAVQVCADHRQWRLQAGPRVRRATDDLHRQCQTGIDLAHLQSIGSGVRCALQDLCDNDAVERVADPGDLFDFKADQGQPRDQLVARCGDLNMFTQPAFRKFHGWESGIGNGKWGMEEARTEAPRLSLRRFPIPDSPFPAFTRIASRSARRFRRNCADR